MNEVFRLLSTSQNILEHLNSFYVASEESRQHLFNKSNDIDIFS